MRVDSAGPRTWLLAGVAGWSVLAWVLALAGMGGRVSTLDADPSLLPALPTPRPAPPERLGPLAQYAEIGTRPLFSEDRRPQAFSLQPEGDEETPANTFDYVLTSVLITPRLHEAIVQPTAGGDSVRIKLGEAASDIPDWRLVELNPRSAMFEGPGGQKSLELRVWDGSGGQPPTSVREANANVEPTEMPMASALPEPPPKAVSKPIPAAPPTTTTTTTPPTKEADDATAKAQMDAIRRRIEQRRAQLRQQSQQPPPPAQNP